MNRVELSLIIIIVEFKNVLHLLSEATFVFQSELKFFFSLWWMVGEWVTGLFKIDASLAQVGWVFA